MAGCGLSQPDQADHRSGHQHHDRHPAGLVGGQLGPETTGDLAGIAEFCDRRRGGLGGRDAGGSMRVRRVQQPGTQLGEDPGLGPRRAGQPGRDLSQVTLDGRAGPRLRAWPGHGVLTAGGAGFRSAVTAAEKSLHVLRSVSRARRPAGVSW